MSGLEIAAAVIGFLETAISLLGRLHKAYERQKDIPELLAKHISALEKMDSAIKLIRNEDALQTTTVVAELAEMDRLVRKLVALLKDLSKNRSASGQFFHQLVRGSDDEKKLDSIMQDLSRQQDHLALRVQVAHVGLTRTLNDKIVVEAKAVDRIDKLVQQVFGDGKGLKMMEFLQSRRLEGGSDAVVSLTDQDMAALPSADNTANLIEGTRLVKNNLTEDQAIQINGPVGDQGWTEVKHVLIEGNKATNSSKMVNHAISMEAFKALLEKRG